MYFSRKKSHFHWNDPIFHETILFFKKKKFELTILIFVVFFLKIILFFQKKYYFSREKSYSLRKKEKNPISHWKQSIFYRYNKFYFSGKNILFFIEKNPTFQGKILYLKGTIPILVEIIILFMEIIIFLRKKSYSLRKKSCFSSEKSYSSKKSHLNQNHPIFHGNWKNKFEC